MPATESAPDALRALWTGTSANESRQANGFGEQTHAAGRGVEATLPQVEHHLLVQRADGGPVGALHVVGVDLELAAAR
jgi:hypothetical protein